MDWLTKHEPTTLAEYVGSRDVIEGISAILMEPNSKTRYILIHGDPGTGKTLLVKLITKEFGYNLVDINASDERGMKVIKDLVSKMNTEVDGDAPKALLLDEIDGFHAWRSLERMIKSIDCPA